MPTFEAPILSAEKVWPAEKVRSTFISYFKEHHHLEWESSLVVPHNDPSLLFINAGMNQFKPLFLGTIDSASNMAKLKRAVNSQKCIRAGGKHNDLDDVGKDVYHHTFFEMLGTWSFGDYFKLKAIDMAWEILTNVYHLNPDRIYATYYGGDDKQPDCHPDYDAKNFWLNYLPPERVLPFGMKDNFWEMAETGPCGPCSEIHYDRIGNRDASHLVNCDDPNVLEIWNLVFMQFNRETGGILKPLPAPCVDTGLGFERLVSVLQNVDSNYDTDIFHPIFDSISKILNLPFKYESKLGEEDIDKHDMTFRIIADHIRCLTVAIADGAIPSNEGRGYVIRRILRRALRYGRQYLSAPTSSPWFYKLVDSVLATVGLYFTDLHNNKDKIKEIIKEEEISFSKTLDRGVDHFMKIMQKLPASQANIFPGNAAFTLQATYGFPLDLTQVMAEENGLSVDLEQYNQRYKEHQMISQAKKEDVEELINFGPDELYELSTIQAFPKTDDKYKYQFDTSSNTPPQNLNCNVLAIFDGKHFTEQTSDHLTALILDKSNFYTEQGGQIGDIGKGYSNDTIFDIVKVKSFGGYILHIGVVENGSIKVGDTIDLEVDWDRRKNISINHTATHVLNFALRKILGGTCDQKGSLVDANRLRFDFEHSKALTINEVKQIQQHIQQSILEDQKIYIQEVPLTHAHSIAGIRAVFGESYPDPVRIVSIGKEVNELLKAGPDEVPGSNYSIEFCGGTHITSTYEIQECVLISESSISKGVRRIEALTNQEAKTIKKNDTKALQEIKMLQNMSIDQLQSISRLEDVEIFATLELSYITSKYIKDCFDSLMKTKVEAEKIKFKELSKIAKTMGEELGHKCSNSKTYFITQSYPEFNGNGKALDIVVKGFSTTNNQTAGFFVTNGENGLSAICIVPTDHPCTNLNAKDWLNASLLSVGGHGGGSPQRAVGASRKVNEIEPVIAASQKYTQQHITT